MASGEKQRVQELLAEIGNLDERYRRPWSFVVLIFLAVGAGLATILLPRVDDVVLSGRYLSSLIYGLISIVLLLNIYLLWQAYALRLARADLVRELLRADAAERMALTDPLTGLFNRRYLERVLATEIKRASRSGKTLSLMILDLDHFGKVNKKHGHLEGDRLLCDFSGFLLDNFRETDFVVRYGGDEFLIVMPETTEKEAEAARQRYYQKVEEWNRQREALPVTACVGIAEIADSASVSVAIEAADEQLRRAKRSRIAESAVSSA